MKQLNDHHVSKPPYFNIYLFGGVISVLGYFALPWPATHPIYRLAVDAIAATATGVGIKRYRPQPSYPWKVLHVGQILGLAADCIWAYQQSVPKTIHFPGPDDAAFLLAYSVLALALWFLVRQKSSRADMAVLLDVSIFVGAVGLVFWVAFMEPAVESRSLSFWAQSASVAFPLIDLVLLAFVCRLFIGGGLRNASSRMLGIAFVATLIADTMYSVLSSLGKYQIGNPFDAGWMIMWLLLGAAALHPDMRVAYTPQTEPKRPAVCRIWILASALLLVPLSLVVEDLRKGSVDVVEFVFASTVLTSLFIGRLNLLMRELKRKLIELRESGDVLRASLRQKRRLENELSHLASHDSLTCLPNRTLFFDRLSQAIVGTRTSAAAPAVLFIDLDDFKVINDRYGHNVGDEMLVSVARRLARCLRPYDSAARIGGDEFAVLLPDVVSEADAVRVAKRVLSSVTSSVELSTGAWLTLTCSVGVAMGSGCNDNSEELVQRADIAMYSAKRDGKNKVALFRPEMAATLYGRLQLKDCINEALQNDQFEVAYQPIVGLRDGRINGVEALVRWHHPERGTIPPSEFIPVAEDSGLIKDIDRSVMVKAVSQVAKWRSISGADSLFVSCNVSPALLSLPSFAEFVKNVLSETGLPAQSLIIEITERTLADDIETVVGSLSRLRDVGVKIAVDDFGTGYSSLGYLRRFPLDVLKIDKSFIDNIAVGMQDAALAKTVIGLGDALGLSVIAEGVEEESQADVLTNIGCQRAQGYLFAAPLAPKELTKALVEGSGRVAVPLQAAALS